MLHKLLCMCFSYSRVKSVVPTSLDSKSWSWDSKAARFAAHCSTIMTIHDLYSLSYIILLSWPIWHELTRYDWWQFWNLCRSVLHYTATLYQIVTNFAAIVQAINASPDKTAHLYCIYVAVGWVNRLRSFIDDTARGMWDYVRCLVLEVVCTDVSGWLSHHVFSLCYIMYFR